MVVLGLDGSRVGGKEPVFPKKSAALGLDAPCADGKEPSFREISAAVGGGAGLDGPRVDGKEGKIAAPPVGLDIPRVGGKDPSFPKKSAAVGGGATPTFKSSSFQTFLGSPFLVAILEGGGIGGLGWGMTRANFIGSSAVSGRCDRESP